MTVGVAHALDASHAPVAANPAEALLFPLLYETLVRVDCTGRLRGGLATSWQSRDDGRVWEVRLDTSARFWDGSSVTAGDVVASLLERAPPGISVVGVRDERTVSIRFERPQAVGPLALADPALAIARRARGSSWPLGTGPHRIDPRSEGRSGSGQGALTVLPAAGAPVPELRFLIRPGADERDLLDEGADLLVTRGAAVLEYVLKRSGLVLAALPWDRTYVLIAPARVRGPEPAELGSQPGLPSELRERLARDAVTGAARAHAGAPPTGSAGSCELGGWGTAPPPVVSPPVTLAQRILYAEDDPTARQLAGRVVALALRAGARGSADAFSDALAAAVPGLRRVGSLQARGLPAGEFEDELRRRSAVLYVLAAPLRAVGSCAWLEWARRRAPWLGVDRARSAVVPLIDTRPHLVAREGLPAVHVDGNGALRFLPDVAQRRER